MGAVFSKRLTVYWSESDAAGIAHFSSFFKFLEWTEEDFMEEVLGSLPSRPRIIFPRVHASCDYKRPLRVHDKVRIDIVAVLLGRSSITYEFIVFNETLGVESASCRIVAVAVDTETLKAVALPKELVEALLRRGAELKGSSEGRGNSASVKI